MEEGKDVRKYLVFFAKLALQAERYDELVETIKMMARLERGLDPEERHLFFIGHKHAIGARRKSWLVLSSLEKQDEDMGSRGSKQHSMWITQYKKEIEDEISELCNEALAVIAIYLLPSATGESLVHYCKLKGDYYRYLAEFRNGIKHQEAAIQSFKAYQAAMSTAVMYLPPSHPIRVSIALNFSIFYCEIMRSPESACQLAQKAFDDAATEIILQGENSFCPDSFPILQMIQKNLASWTSYPTGRGYVNLARDIRISPDQLVFFDFIKLIRDGVLFSLTSQHATAFCKTLSDFHKSKYPSMRACHACVDKNRSARHVNDYCFVVPDEQFEDIWIWDFDPR